MKKQGYHVLILAALASLSLSSCQTPASIRDLWPDDWETQSNNTRPSEKPIQTPTTEATASSSTTKTSAPVVSKTGVVVPPSYYLAEGTPVSHQTSDTSWVDKQDSSEYTIQLASGNSASNVAQVLQQAPKNARMAQVQYNSNGQTGYVGVYGTYATKEEADAALSKLPANLRSNAKIESWDSVQTKIQSSPTSIDEDTIAPPDIFSVN